MSLLRIKAIAHKEAIQIGRDPLSLGMAIVIPIILIVLFGYALTVDVDNVSLLVWDQDSSPASRDFILHFQNSPYFNVIGFAQNYSHVQRFIDKGKTQAALVIPRYFSKKLEASRTCPVQAIVDGTDANTATIISGYMDSVAAAYNNKLMTACLLREGKTYRPAVEIGSRAWFNAELKSRNNIVPALIAVIMMVIAALLTSLTIAREWERGTMEQLISTPVKSYEIIWGKFIPYFVIGLFDVFVAVIMGAFLFHVPFRGNIVLLFSLSSLFLAGALSLGILISIVAKSQLAASQLAMITSFLPAFLLSGFVSSISNMPKALQVVTYCVPARYFIIILRGIYLKGAGLEVLYKEVIFLFLFSFGVFKLATVAFKKKVI